MANGKYLFGIDGIASSDLRTKRGYCLTFGSDGDHLDLISDAPQPFAGVLINDPNVGEIAEALFLGEASAIADGSGTAISVGDSVGPNDSGVMVKKATSDYSVAGIARDACAVANVEIRVLLTPNIPFRTRAD